MALFKSSNPEKQMASDIAAARTNRDRLAARLVEAEHAVLERRSAAQRLALDGADDMLLDKAEAALRASQDRATTLASAITDAEQHLVTFEKAQAEYQDQKTRAATAAECEKMATDLEAVAMEFDAAVTGLAAITERAALHVYEASGLNQYASASRLQLPPAIEMIAAGLRGHATAVLSGDAPATLRTPDAPFVETPVVKAPTVLRFALRPVKWIAADGKRCAAQKFTDAALTESAASRGVAMGAVVGMDSPLRKQHHGTAPGHVRVDLALDLDAEPVHQQVEPIEPSSQFTVIDRGGPIPMRVARS